MLINPHFSLHSLLQCSACIVACTDDVGRATLTAARSTGRRAAADRAAAGAVNCITIRTDYWCTAGGMQHKTMMGMAEGEKLNSSSGLCRLR
jgi:hypothetical protein